jgi:hypothetical protein
VRVVEALQFLAEIGLERLRPDDALHCEADDRVKRTLRLRVVRGLRFVGPDRP